jgi:lipoate-protein ligase A
MRLCVDLTPRDVALGLATEEALLEAARQGGEDAIRLWVANRAVVVGRSQSVASECDRRAAIGLGIPIVRRISGGGTVYHYPGNLNVSLIVGDSGCLGTVEEAFVRWGDALAVGLRGTLGAAAERRESAVFLGNRKVSGAAQARRGRAVLLHATLLVRPDGLKMASLLRALRPGYVPQRVPSRPHATTTLTEALGRPVELEEAADAALRALAGVAAGPWTRGEITASEAQRAAELQATRYRSPGWNESL